jgi:hypothetical protein
VAGAAVITTHWLAAGVGDAEGWGAGDSSWGGPTLVGAWIVHAMVAVDLQVAGLALIRGLGTLCGRITRPLLGE